MQSFCIRQQNAHSVQQTDSADADENGDAEVDLDMARIDFVEIKGIEPFNSFCQKCDPGFYADETASQLCKPCPEGTFQRREGRSSCDPCAENTWSRPGSTSCEQVHSLSSPRNDSLTIHEMIDRLTENVRRRTIPVSLGPAKPMEESLLDQRGVPGTNLATAQLGVLHCPRMRKYHAPHVLKGNVMAEYEVPWAVFVNLTTDLREVKILVHHAVVDTPPLVIRTIALCVTLVRTQTCFHVPLIPDVLDRLCGGASPFFYGMGLFRGLVWPHTLLGD